MALSYSKSCLIGAIMESIVYGLYLTFFLQTLQILRRKMVKGRVFVYLSATTIVLFVLITMRMVLDNKAAVEAFTNDPFTPHAADIYYTSFGNGAMFRTGTYIALTIVADMFIVYRVFAVWSRNIWITVVPFLLAIADIVSGALVIQTIRGLEAGASPDGNTLATHLMVFYSFTLGLNVLCTILIALRISIAQWEAAASHAAPSLNLNSTLVILIESAAIYSLCLIVMLVPTAKGSNVQYCMLSMMPGVVGLAFSLIIVRVGSGLSPNATSGADTTLHFAAGQRSFATSQFGSQSQDEATAEHATTDHGGIEVHLNSAIRSASSMHMNSDSKKDANSDGGKAEV